MPNPTAGLEESRVAPVVLVAELVPEGELEINKSYHIRRCTLHHRTLPYHQQAIKISFTHSVSMLATPFVFVKSFGGMGLDSVSVRHKTH